MMTRDQPPLDYSSHLKCTHGGLLDAGLEISNPTS